MTAKEAFQPVPHHGTAFLAAWPFLFFPAPFTAGAASPALELGVGIGALIAARQALSLAWNSFARSGGAAR